MKHFEHEIDQEMADQFDEGFGCGKEDAARRCLEICAVADSAADAAARIRQEFGLSAEVSINYSRDEDISSPCIITGCTTHKAVPVAIIPLKEGE